MAAQASVWGGVAVKAFLASVAWWQWLLVVLAFLLLVVFAAMRGGSDASRDEETRLDGPQRGGDS